MKITTLKLQDETKLRLDKLRESRNESYDDILRKILYVLNTTREDPFKAKRILERVSELRERMIDAEKQEDIERKADKVAKKKKKTSVSQKKQKTASDKS